MFSRELLVPGWNGVQAAGRVFRVPDQYPTIQVAVDATASGDDPIFGTTLGIASDATLIGNRFCEVATPILVEPLVTGVEEHGSRLNDCRGCERDHERD